MSIQTTRTISRENAVKKAVDKYLERQREYAESVFSELDNDLVEEYIEEEFYNYTIDKEI